jgi:hypothetical protein
VVEDIGASAGLGVPSFETTPVQPAAPHRHAPLEAPYMEPPSLSVPQAGDVAPETPTSRDRRSATSDENAAAPAQIEPRHQSAASLPAGRPPTWSAEDEATNVLRARPAFSARGDAPSQTGPVQSETTASSPPVPLAGSPETAPAPAKARDALHFKPPHAKPDKASRPLPAEPRPATAAAEASPPASPPRPKGGRRGASTTEAPTGLHLRIHRIDVHAPVPTPRPTPPSGANRDAALSLDDYLTRRRDR